MPHPADARSVIPMIGLLVSLLILWIALSVLGFAVKGLFWLAVIGIVLFLATGVFGLIRRGGRGTSV